MPAGKDQQMLDPKPRQKMMADKLYNEIAHGRLEGEFVESFVPRVREKLKAGRELSEREVEILEDLFEKN